MEGDSVSPHRRKDDIVNMVCAGIIVLIILAVLIIAGSGCRRQTAQYPSPYATDCEAAYHYIKFLGCDDLLIVPGFDEIPNTDDDHDWISFCQETQSGDVLSMDLECALLADNCAEIEHCL